MAPPTNSYSHNSHPNQNQVHDKHAEAKAKRKLAIISSNPDPKNLPQIVKCNVDLGSTSYHAGCHGQHHRHSGIPLPRGGTNSNKPNSSSGGAHARGDLIPYPQNHDIKKINKAAPEPAKRQHQQQNAPPPSSGLINRKPILVNKIASKIPKEIKSMMNNNDQQCTSSVVDCCNTPHVQFISDINNSFDRQQSCKSMQCCAIPSEVNSNAIKESITIGQQCTKSITCCSDVSKYKLENPNCRINHLKDKILGHIFGFLNHSDVVQCRAVQKRWNDLIISAESFLDSTVFVVNIQKSYNVKMDTLSYNDDPLTIVQLPFRHARFQYFDHHYLKEPQTFAFRNSDNQRYFPKSSFLKNLKSLEFRSSFLLWKTLKRILANTLVLESLSISNCHLSQLPLSTYSITEFEECTVANVVSEMRGLEMNEMRDLNSSSTLVEKFVGYYSRNLNTLKISYYPPAGTRDSLDDRDKLDCVDFCRHIKTLISLNAKNLQILSLQIHHEPTLDLLGGHLGKELEALGQSMNLEEFQFTSALGCWMNHPDKAPETNVAMTMRNVKNTPKMIKAVTKAFAKFLNSQTNLKRLGLPCIEYPEALTRDFASVLNGLPCSENLEELIAPCPGLLPENFLHRFPKLRRVKLGGACCGDISPCWNIFKGYITENESKPTASKPSEWNLAIINAHLKITSKTRVITSSTVVLESSGSSQENLERMKNIKALSVSSLENARHFSSLAKCLPNLSTLEVKSDFNGPVMTDNDLQACVQHLTRLRNLTIDHSDNFTDFGLTGIPNNYCQLMFKHQRYHLEGVNMKIWNSEKITGRPLSDLKGLRKLVLMGSCQVTDIGIGYGLEFQELVYCHLPYSHHITSWGIARVGSMNPSVESMVLSGVNKDTKEAFKKLKCTHQRLKKGDVSRSKYYKEHESLLQDDFSLILPTPKEVFETLITFVSNKVSAILFLFKREQEKTPHAIEVNDQ